MLHWLRPNCRSRFPCLPKTDSLTWPWPDHCHSPKNSLLGNNVICSMFLGLDTGSPLNIPKHHCQVGLHLIMYISFWWSLRSWTHFSLSMVHAFSAITARKKELSLRVPFNGTSLICVTMEELNGSVHAKLAQVDLLFSGAWGESISDIQSMSRARLSGSQTATHKIKWINTFYSSLKVKS